MKGDEIEYTWWKDGFVWWWEDAGRKIFVAGQAENARPELGEARMQDEREAK